MASHVEGLAGARIAVDDGVDTIEHGLSLHRGPWMLERMAERGIVFVPTLSRSRPGGSSSRRFAPALVEQSKRRFVDAYRT